MSEFTASSKMRSLIGSLHLIDPSMTFVESFDSDNYPVVKVTSGSEVVYIKIATVEGQSRVDGIGLPQRVYSPHKCIMLSASGAEPAFGRYVIFSEIVKLGMRIDMFGEAVLPSSFTLVGATKIGSIAADPINPLQMSQ